MPAIDMSALRALREANPLWSELECLGEIFLQATGQAEEGLTPTFVNLGAEGSSSVPAGSKRHSFLVLTGTATYGDLTALPAGFSQSETVVNATAIPVTTAAASSAKLIYWT